MALALAACIVIMLTTNLSAGLVANSWSAGWNDEPNSWSWDWDESNLQWDITEGFDAVSEAEMWCEGETDQDPNITIVKDVTNDSGVAWTGFTVELTGTNVTYVSGSASVTSGPFSVDSEMGDVVTLGSGTLNPGDSFSFSFSFDFNIPANVNFTATINQTPIPEPATVALLGLGLVFVARRRRCGV